MCNRPWGVEDITNEVRRAVMHLENGKARVLSKKVNSTWQSPVAPDHPGRLTVLASQTPPPVDDSPSY